MRILTALVLALPLAAQHDMSNMPDMPGMDHSKLQKNSTEPMMDMIQLKAAGWNLGFHGVAFLTSIQETGPRGHDKAAAINWLMGEASHPLAGGTFSVLTMLSLDPATVTGRYYPELFQTGETAFGKPIVDGQHPHNFVMNLGLHYSHRLAGGDVGDFCFSGGRSGPRSRGVCPPDLCLRTSAGHYCASFTGLDPHRE